MLWYCRFSWFPGTTTERVRQRVLRQHAAGTNHPEMIRGWYNLAGGGAGFMLVEAEDARILNTILEPYMDLVRWDVHAVYELPYAAVTDHFREVLREAAKPGIGDNKATALVGAAATTPILSGRPSLVPRAKVPSVKFGFPG